MSGRRRAISKDTETYVLVASRRRCCICYFLLGATTPRKGQIAHLNRDPGDATADNLVYLCLDHHDEFDSRTSQSKGLSVSEVRHYRGLLYRELGTQTLAPPPVVEQVATPTREAGPAPQTRPSTLSFIDLPWRLNCLEAGRPELFAFKASNLCDGICRIERIPLRDGRVLVICEEIDENPGLSVTNGMEELALQLCEQLRIVPADLVLIEHYRTHYADEDEWNRVEFRSRDSKTGFVAPSWRPMSQADWISLGYKPRKRPRPWLVRQSLLVPIRASRGRGRDA